MVTFAKPECQILDQSFGNYGTCVRALTPLLYIHIPPCLTFDGTLYERNVRSILCKQHALAFSLRPGVSIIR